MVLLYQDDLRLQEMGRLRQQKRKVCGMTSSIEADLAGDTGMCKESQHPVVHVLTCNNKPCNIHHDGT